MAAVEIEVVYQGALRCRGTHGPSGEQLTTDAPLDNCGKGETFSPTDLVATALGGCILTILAIVSERHGIALEGTRVSVEKHMVSDPVRRIGRLPVVVEMSTAVTERQQDILRRAASTCPVLQSLHPRIDKTISFLWK
jgi:putative redox protein